ncbi:MAG: hypothetical protein K2H98_03195, partial [Duncaniella sp.]|nr:hypothetical protein [Duncaniella sp.]
MTSSYVDTRSPVATTVATALLSTVFYAFTFTVLAFWTGIALSWWQFPAAIIAAGVTAISLVPGIGRRDAIYALISAAAILVCSIIAARFTVDYSFDGLYYHQEIIAALCDGWNPFAPPFDSAPSYSVWAVHYAKAIEIAAASVVSMTGSIEAGKAVNLIMVAGMAAAVWAWTSAVRPLAPHRLVITLVATANPVVLAQLFTYYIDFYKYVYLIFVLTALCDISAGRRRGYAVLFMTLILAMATKFNIFFEAGVWIIAAMIWWGWH